MNAYLLSGLGADKRIFTKLTFPKKYVIQHIDWIAPLHNEEVTAYSKRLSAQIDQDQPFVLIGVSFGGIIAVEIGNFLKPVRTIILSSASGAGQIPWYYKVCGILKLHQVVPTRLLKAPTALLFWFFGIKGKEQRDLLTQILKETDESFLKWAISKITTWKQNLIPKNLYHIHGTADRILPMAFIKPDLQIPNGGHLMVYDQYELITKILADKLN